MTYPVILLNRPAPAVAFPQRCAGCGAPPAATSTLGLSRLVVTRGQSQRSVTASLAVPHCARCARLNKTVFLAGFVPFLAGGLIVGLAAFAGAFLLSTQLGLDEMTDDEPWPSLVIGAFAGLLVGLAGGFVTELVARVVLLPLMGRPLWQAPLLAAQFLGDSDYVPGVTGKLSPDGTEIWLRFNHDDFGREVAALNRPT